MSHDFVAGCQVQTASLSSLVVRFLLLMISFFHDLTTFSTEMEKLLLKKGIKDIPVLELFRTNVNSCC